MMGMKKIIQTTVMAAACGMLLAACQYKDLIEDNGGQERYPVTLAFDWQRVDSVPRGMRVVFYPHDTEYNRMGYTLFDVPDSNSVIYLPKGSYDVITYNNDCHHNIVDSYGNIETATARTGSYSPHGDAYIPRVLDSLYHGQPVMDYPDYMVHATRRDYAVTGQNDSITMMPDSMVITIDVTVNGIDGLTLCRNIRGAMNYVAHKRKIAADNEVADTVAVMFDGMPDSEDRSVKAHFYVYGLYKPQDEDICLMTIFFWLPHTQVYVPINITALIKEYREGTVYVNIETGDIGLDLNDYNKSETGITVTAEDWEETETIELKF